MTRDRWLLLVIGGCLLLLLGMGAAMAVQNKEQSDSAATATAWAVRPTGALPVEPTHDNRSDYQKCRENYLAVRYIVESNSYRLGFSWTNDRGGVEQHEMTYAPRCFEFTNFHTGDYVMFSAQILSDGDYYISCEIRAGDQIIAQARSEGFASVASCSGFVP